MTNQKKDKSFFEKEFGKKKQEVSIKNFKKDTNAEKFNSVGVSNFKRSTKNNDEKFNTTNDSKFKKNSERRDNYKSDKVNKFKESAENKDKKFDTDSPSKFKKNTDRRNDNYNSERERNFKKRVKRSDDKFNTESTSEFKKNTDRRDDNYNSERERNFKKRVERSDDKFDTESPSKFKKNTDRRDDNYNSERERNFKKRVERRDDNYNTGNSNKFKTNSTTRTSEKIINKDTTEFKKDTAYKQLEDPIKRFTPNPKIKPQKNVAPPSEPLALNKYIAHCGICSRRDAVNFIKQGKVKINGELIDNPAHRVHENDIVSVAGKKITIQKNLTYVLLNKPKGFITTTDDEKDRKTVMDLVSIADEQRLYPIGRLDRNTTGLLILTNDGDLAQKLSHPKFNIKKVYHVSLDKNLAKADYDTIIKGITLEDGDVKVDDLAILENKNEIGIEIHNGKNRIVRRIFEHLGYVVEKLDRVIYAGLTKKNLPRGTWRHLTEQELIFLKHFNQGKKSEKRNATKGRQNS